MPAGPGQRPEWLDECPTSLVTPQALEVVDDFLRGKLLRRAPRGGGYHRWPARLVDCWALLESELLAWKESQRRRA